MSIMGRKKDRREGFELSLTAMIDIFSMIVIFLIMGTVFSGLDLEIPGTLTLPKSYSKESLEQAPKVLVAAKTVTFILAGAKKEYPLELFQTQSLVPTEIEALNKEIKTYIDSMNSKLKASGVFINFIADEQTPYRDVFNVAKTFRQAGFQTLLFVAQGASQ
jgi:biopolymer transport protein ExbD